MLLYVCVCVCKNAKLVANTHERNTHFGGPHTGKCKANGCRRRKLPPIRRSTKSTTKKTTPHEQQGNMQKQTVGCYESHSYSSFCEHSNTKFYRFPSETHGTNSVCAMWINRRNMVLTCVRNLWKWKMVVLLLLWLVFAYYTLLLCHIPIQSSFSVWT